MRRCAGGKKWYASVCVMKRDGEQSVCVKKRGWKCRRWLRTYAQGRIWWNDSEECWWEKSKRTKGDGVDETMMLRRKALSRKDDVEVAVNIVPTRGLVLLADRYTCGLVMTRVTRREWEWDETQVEVKRCTPVKQCRLINQCQQLTIYAVDTNIFKSYIKGRLPTGGEGPSSVIL